MHSAFEMNADTCGHIVSCDVIAHCAGGTDGLKGQLSHINEIPFAAIDAGAKNVWGTGATPEGIDQNPVYDDTAPPAFSSLARIP